MTRLIDADAFIKENKDIIDCEIDHPKYQDTLRELISQAPTVERPHGEWIYKGGKYWCSSCGEKAIYHSHVKEPLPHLTNYCPNCGASMVSVNSKIEKSNSKICPCIECCKIDNSEPCRKGCSYYQKWKASEME